MKEALGAVLGAQADQVIQSILADSAGLSDRRQDALIEVLIGMIVAALERDRSDADFVSRLDRCVERLRSAGMARLSQSGGAGS